MAMLNERPPAQENPAHANQTHENASGDASLDVDAAAESGPAILDGAPSSGEFNKLRKRLVRLTREALDQYGMIRRGDRWLVCLSGGKDSYTLLAVLLDLQWRGLLPVDLLACNLDQGQPGFPKHVLPEFLDRVGVRHRIEYRDTYSIVMDKVPAAKTYCRRCARDAVHALWSAPEPPDALFVGNDHMAFAVIDTLRHELGLSVPGDVSVIGYDDVPVAAWPAFDLTTWRQPSERMVSETISCLLRRIDDPSALPRKITVPGQLVVRGSARVPDTWAQTAL